MPGLPPALQQVLNQTLVSLSGWLIIEGLTRLPAKRRALSQLVLETGLDVTQASRAIQALCRRGVLVQNRAGRISFAPSLAEQLTELVAHVEADRDLQREVIRQAARRECRQESCEVWVAWVPEAPPVTHEAARRSGEL